jgi:HAE1 family hydrophobic/amphiphilic exporter-1
MSLSETAVRRPVTMVMVLLITIVIGVMSFLRLGLDLMPDIDFPTVTIMTKYPGAGSEDIEKRLSRVLEGAVATVQRVTSVKSYSQEGMSYVLVEFEWGSDLDAAANDLREAIGLVEAFLPDGADEPLVVKFSLGAFPVLGYGVAGMGGDVVALNAYLEDALLPRLERLEGVAQAILLGGPKREVHIDLDRPAVENTGVTIDQVVAAIASQNVETPGGALVQDGEEFHVRATGAFESLRQVEETVVGMGKTGALIRLRDVANVRMSVADSRNKNRTSGQDSLILFINKQSGSNPLDVARRVKKELAAVQKELPKDVVFSVIMDTGHQIEKVADNLVEDGSIGGVLAVAFLYLFLRSWRPTFAIAIVIPVSLLATFVPMYLMGETLNMMTMGGLMLGVGMLVDNAVVIIENVFRHLEKGSDRKTAAAFGAKEMGLAILASTLANVVVFLPLYFGTGLAGELVRGLAAVVFIAQWASLAVAIIIVPTIASLIFSPRDAQRAAHASERFNQFTRRYERVLRWSLVHRKTVGAVTTLIVVGSAALLPTVGADFLPKMDQPMVIGKLKFPVGTPMEVTERASRAVEEMVRSQPEVETVGVSVGVNEDDAGAGLSEFNPTGPHEAQLWIRLREDRQTSQEEFMARLRKDAPAQDGVSVEFLDMGQAMMGGGASKPIEIKLFGDELPVLQRLSEDIAQAIDAIPGVDDVDTSLREGRPERHLDVDREKAASYGLTVGEVARTLEAATLGLPAGLFRIGGDEFVMRVRYDRAGRATTRDLERVRVPTRAGFSVPIGQLGQFREGSGPVRITREDQARRVSIRAALTEGRDIQSVIGDVRKALEPVRAKLPLGYRIEFGGTFEQMQEAFVTLAGGILLATLLVYMVMAAQFEALLHPFIIMVTLPLSIVGVALAHIVTQTPVTAVTLVGFMVLAGIVVNNGIVMIDRVNELRRDGVPRMEALVQGCLTRLRPVLITSGASVSGLLPAIVWADKGAELTRDLSLAIAGGLTVATMMTLVVLPVVYEILDDWGDAAKRRILRLLHADEVEAPPLPADAAARLASEPT